MTKLIFFALFFIGTMEAVPNLKALCIKSYLSKITDTKLALNQINNGKLPPEIKELFSAYLKTPTQETVKEQFQLLKQLDDNQQINKLLISQTEKKLSLKEISVNLIDGFIHDNRDDNIKYHQDYYDWLKEQPISSQKDIATYNKIAADARANYSQKLKLISKIGCCTVLSCLGGTLLVVFALNNCGCIE